MINGLKSRHILLIAPRFFGYEKEIKHALEICGAYVEYFDERPQNNFVTKALIRINRNFLKKRIRQYYKEILQSIRGNTYDYILVINPEAMSLEIVNLFKEQFQRSCFILYMWDSFRNKKGAQKMLHLFDRVFSFDRSDFNLNENIKFRPLFFVESYAALRKKKNERRFHITFIGTAHSDRYAIARSLKEFAEKKELLTFFYMYLQSPLIFRKNKLIKKSFRNASSNEFAYHPLPKEKILDTIENSVAILDIHHPAQSGLTIRTLEILGAGRKLITTNTDIINYDFYQPQNIFIIDRDNLEINDSFLNSEYVPIDDRILYRYSIMGWIEEIFFPSE